MGALLTGLWFVSILSALVAFWDWAGACRKLGRLREFHHLWIGVALALPPWHWRLGWFALVPWSLGWWIAWDDAHLHKGQAEWWRKGMTKLTGADDRASFWHRLAAKAGVI